MKQFLRDETGAVTVDFVVLAGVAAIMGTIVTAAVRTGAEATGTGLQENFTQKRIKTNLHPPEVGSTSLTQQNICDNSGGNGNSNWQNRLASDLGSQYSGNINDLVTAYSDSGWDTYFVNNTDKEIMRHFRAAAEHIEYRPDSINKNRATAADKDAYVEAMFAMCELSTRDIGANLNDYLTPSHIPGNNNNRLPYTNQIE